MRTPKLRIRDRAKFLKAIWKDPRTPWHAKAVLAATLAYALSPIDLIPDFIPVLGYLDDAVIVPLGLWLAYKLVSREVWEEHKRAFEAGAAAETKTVPKTAKRNGPVGPRNPAEGHHDGKDVSAQKPMRNPQ